MLLNLGKLRSKTRDIFADLLQVAQEIGGEASTLENSLLIAITIEVGVTIGLM